MTMVEVFHEKTYLCTILWKSTLWHELPDFLVGPPPDPLVDVPPLLFGVAKVLLVNVGVEYVFDVLGVAARLSSSLLHQSLPQRDKVAQEQWGSLLLGSEHLEMT